MPQLEHAMNIFYIIGVVVVIVFVAECWGFTSEQTIPVISN